MEHTYKLAFHNNLDVIFSLSEGCLSLYGVACFYLNYKLRQTEEISRAAHPLPGPFIAMNF